MPSISIFPRLHSLPQRSQVCGALLAAILLPAVMPSLAVRADEKIDPRLAPFFQPPAEFAGDLATYQSPLRFDDGRPVTTAAEWPKRREEILKTWHDLMGPWPPLLEKPKIEYLAQERRENITQHHVRIEIAPGVRTDDAYLLVPDGAPNPAAAATDGDKPAAAASQAAKKFPAVLVVYYDAKTGAGLGKEMRDFGYQLARRGFVALSLGGPAGSPRAVPSQFDPSQTDPQKQILQPLSYNAYVAANCHTILANLPAVDPARIGVVGHSYGGKWAMFASCLYEKFACGVWSDGGVVFDEKRGNVNYWEPWYLGNAPGEKRERGIPNPENPRTGAYKRMIEAGRDLHELHALMAPRPFLVSGGAEDKPHRWRALNHAIAVNRLLGFENRVAMTNRPSHAPTPESNEQIYLFFEQFLKP